MMAGTTESPGCKRRGAMMQQLRGNRLRVGLAHASNLLRRDRIAAQVLNVAELLARIVRVRRFPALHDVAQVLIGLIGQHDLQRDELIARRMDRIGRECLCPSSGTAAPHSRPAE